MVIHKSFSGSALSNTTPIDRLNKFIDEYNISKDQIISITRESHSSGHTIHLFYFDK